MKEKVKKINTFFKLNKKEKDLIKKKRIIFSIGIFRERCKYILGGHDESIWYDWYKRERYFINKKKFIEV